MTGDAQKIFNDLIVDAEQLPSGAYKLKDGRIIHKYGLSSTGVDTIHINQNGKIDKVRVR